MVKSCEQNHKRLCSMKFKKHFAEQNDFLQFHSWPDISENKVFWAQKWRAAKRLHGRAIKWKCSARSMHLTHGPAEKWDMNWEPFLISGLDACAKIRYSNPIKNNAFSGSLSPRLLFRADACTLSRSFAFITYQQWVYLSISSFPSWKKRRLLVTTNVVA